MDRFLVDRIQTTIDNYRIAKEELRNDGDVGRGRRGWRRGCLSCLGWREVRRFGL